MYILVAKSRKNEAKWRPHFNDFKNTDTRGSKGGEDHRVTRSVILLRSLLDRLWFKKQYLTYSEHLQKYFSA